MWEILSEIETMHSLVTDPEWLITTTEPRAETGTKSLPPCALNPIVVSDPRSVYTGRPSLVSAPRVLRAWAEAVSESRGESMPLVWAPYLKLRLPWITSQPACVRFARHIAAVHDSLRKVSQWG